MRVLLIHQAFVSPTDAGGTRHYELARHMVDHGHAFTIVASQFNYLTGRHSGATGSLVAEETIEGIQIRRAYVVPALHARFRWRVVSFLSFMLISIWAALRAGRVDLVMGTSPPIFQAVSAWFVALVRRRPFLLEVRDLWPEFAIDMGVLKRPVLIRLSRWLEHFLYARATHILVNSPAYQDYLLRKGVAPGKVTVIPNGVDPEMYDPAATGDRLRGEWRLDGKFIVTYAGALGTANDIPTILQAARRLRDRTEIHFLMVGDGRERGRLEAMAKELDLPNVNFTGSRTKAEMAEVLAASDACVATLRDIPMFRTTYPNKVFDYMAAGRPTILAIDGVIRMVLEAAGGGIVVPPGDGEALAEAVLSLAEDRARARAMGAAARLYVVEHFNRHDQAREFERLVIRIAEGS